MNKNTIKTKILKKALEKINNEKSNISAPMVIRPKKISPTTDLIVSPPITENPVRERKENIKWQMVALALGVLYLLKK